MNYQPWHNQPSERPCEDRYQIVKQMVFAKYKRSFSVFDFGANLGYFGRRAVEDGFPITYVAIDQIKWPIKVGISLNHKCTPEQVQLLAECEDFDVVLGLSVLHWFERWQIVMDALIALGKDVVIEIPNAKDKGATGQAVIGQIDDYIKLHCNPVLLAMVDSHTSQYQRPIYLLEGKHQITRRYIDWPTLELGRVQIKSTYEEKTIQVKTQKETQFIHGINLRTWQAFGGVWPDAETLAKSIRAGKPPQHSDYRPWNMIVTTTGIQLIDNNWYGNAKTMPTEEIIQGLYGRGEYGLAL